MNYSSRKLRERTLIRFNDSLDTVSLRRKCRARDSKYEPGSNRESDEHTDDYADEDVAEVEDDRAEPPRDEYMEIAEDDCATVGDATGGTGSVYAEKEPGE
ncbi:hypothetical protein PRIC1_004943 [Phytophthora ramorum]